MISDESIMRALIAQVQKAAGGDSERTVLTTISSPMWKAFLRATDTPQDAKATPWKGNGTIRVFGSQTVVIEDDGYWSASRKIA